MAEEKKEETKTATPTNTQSKEAPKQGAPEQRKV
jgi:hypothetical protein